MTNIDRWFLVQIEELVRLEEKVAKWASLACTLNSCAS
ncbi:hypothetical protein ACNKHM_07690 [Shigella sonnei]